ncbi:MAG: hypothetical protein ACJA08_000293 [Cyclobacteriaceae bacterium]|jgi:hypothetical protein
MFKFLSKKKNQFKAQCSLSRQPLDRESSYLVTTAQIISSKKFWDNIMTEPDTMSYTEAYFKNGDSTAANIRGMIFNKYSAVDKAWVISDAQLHLFEIDQQQAKTLADQWWDSEGSFSPEESKTSLKELGDQQLAAIRTYAVTEAGRAFVLV